LKDWIPAFAGMTVGVLVVLRRKWNYAFFAVSFLDSATRFASRKMTIISLRGFA
jgi:hypothetical protein